MLLGSSFFLLVLALLLGLISFGVFSSTLYGRYDSKLKDIITYVEHHADVDDLARCVETGERSDSYREFQTFLNGMVDDLGLEYLYIVIPSDSVMTNVISATNAEERAAGEEDMPLLATTDAYSAAVFRSVCETAGVGFASLKCVSDVYGAGSMPSQYAENLKICLAKLSEAVAQVWR